MSKLRKRLLPLLIMLLSLHQTLSSPPSWASVNLTPDEIQQTIDLLQACDKAQGAQQVEISTQTALNEQYLAQNRLLSDQVVKLQDRNSGILSSPLLWFVGGMLVTGLTVRLVR